MLQIADLSELIENLRLELDSMMDSYRNLSIEYLKHVRTLQTANARLKMVNLNLNSVITPIVLHAKKGPVIDSKFVLDLVFKESS